jgi:hypothetical protein
VPSVDDNAALWVRVRRQVRDHDPDEVVLIGASRMLQAIVPDVFEESFGRRPIQLAYMGSNCMPVLQHFSDEPGFQGVLICDLTPSIVFRPLPLNPPHGVQADLVRKYQELTSWGALEEELSLLVQNSLVARHPDFSSRSVIHALYASHRLPTLSHTTLPDRSRRMDYTQVLPHHLRDSEADLALGISLRRFPRTDLSRYIATIESLVANIQGRGGQVVFVMLPSSGAVRAAEESSFPRARYWDALAAGTSAITIHFEDYPETAHYTCPEGAHLDRRDGVTFTQAFARILQQKLRLARRPSVPQDGATAQTCPAPCQ